MAFLNNVPLRPSCIFSALPKRYQVSLEKELCGSVAISTCRIEQLEDAVKLRGATIAVVGASEDSLEIAERISHRSETVKVFLVHYQDRLASKTMMNGFAGIYDLRQEQQQLAETIRQEALQPTKRLYLAPNSRLEQSRLLEHFIAINERLARPQLVHTLVLDGFLQLARAEAGAFLIASGSSQDAFHVAASRNEDFSEQQTVFLSDEIKLQMLAGEILYLPEGLPLLEVNSWKMDSNYCVGVPLVAGNCLFGCLLAQTNEASDVLTDYALMATHLLSRMRQLEAAAEGERLISAARQKIGLGWVLVSSSGRIVHREGDIAKVISHSSQIKAPRLIHAVKEAILGRKGSICYHGLSVTYERYSARTGEYALICIKEPVAAKPPLETLPCPEAFDFIKVQFSDSPEQLKVIEVLLKGLQDKSPKLPIKLKSLREFGIEIAGTNENPIAEVTGSIALIMLGINKKSGAKVTFAIAQSKERISITFECDETAAAESPAHLPEDFLINLLLNVTEVQARSPQWQFGTFGGRLEWQPQTSC